MKGIFIKITAVAVFAVVLGGVGIFVANKVSAQTAQDCTSTSPTFWGWIACYIGNPAQGISGTATLFQGQKAIYDKIGSGGSTSSANPTTGKSVYIEKTGSSVYLGELIEGSVSFAQKTWGCATSVAGGTVGCPDQPYQIYGFTEPDTTAVFHPSPARAASYSKTREGVTVAPAMCYVLQDVNSTVSASGVFPVANIKVRCSYFPVFCMQQPNVTGSQNCVSVGEADFAPFPGYTNSATLSEQYHIVIK